MNFREYELLLRACKLLSKGPDCRVSDYVSNLLTTVLEFQMTSPASESAQGHYNQTLRSKIRTHKDLAQFLGSYQNTQVGNTQAANRLWNNNCWTRIEFLRALMTYFDVQGVSNMETLRAWAWRTDFHRDVKGKIRSEHHSVGPAIYQWLRLRVGFPTIKADVWIKRFVQEHIGRLPTEQEAEEALVKIAQEMGWAPYELDSAIWYAQSGRPVIKPENQKGKRIPEKPGALSTEHRASVLSRNFAWFFRWACLITLLWLAVAVLRMGFEPLRTSVETAGLWHFPWHNRIWPTFVEQGYWVGRMISDVFKMTG